MKTKKRISGHLGKFLVILPVALIALMCTKTSMDPLLDISPPQGDRLSVPQKSPDGSVYFVVEEMPDFQGGGQEGFRRYIGENVRYPADAKDEGIEGRVFIQFIVKSDGTVGEAKVVRGVHKTLDQEALRVVLDSPEWKPGKQDGKPVDVAFTFPIIFSLKQEE
jgi:periplasmic protein TonB